MTTLKEIEKHQTPHTIDGEYTNEVDVWDYVGELE